VQEYPRLACRGQTVHRPIGPLAELLGPALADSAAVARRASDPRIRQVAGDQACYVIVACARAVVRDLNADWVVMAVARTVNERASG
jgi:uncharacterized protein (DUF2342 family)